MFATEKIHAKVVRVLVESLNVDEADITPTATLQGDLGAESIDFLDIMFRLEREFEIEIPGNELFPERLFHGEPEFVREGRVTDEGMGELRTLLPYADLSGFNCDRRLIAVPDLFTVNLVTRYIAWKLGQGNGAGPGGTEAVPVTHRASPVYQEQATHQQQSPTSPISAKMSQGMNTTWES